MDKYDTSYNLLIERRFSNWECLFIFSWFFYKLLSIKLKGMVPIYTRFFDQVHSITLLTVTSFQLKYIKIKKLEKIPKSFSIMFEFCRKLLLMGLSWKCKLFLWVILIQSITYSNLCSLYSNISIIKNKYSIIKLKKYCTVYTEF